MLGRSKIMLGLALALMVALLTVSATMAQGPRNGKGNANAARANVPAAVTPLTDADAAVVLRTREEEKVARDLYSALGEQWDVPVFARIARAEQHHMDAALRLIERYGLTDPVGDNAAGDFVNTELQALYDDLLARGMTSLPEALAVGAYFEDMDIAGLEAEIAATENADLDRVFGHLLAASKNHLRAFAAAYEAETGEAYVPVELSAEAYAAILADTNERGGMRGQGNGHGRHNPGNRDGNGQRDRQHDGTCDHSGTNMERRGEPMSGNGECDGTCDGTGMERQGEPMGANANRRGPNR